MKRMQSVQQPMRALCLYLLLVGVEASVDAPSSTSRRVGHLQYSIVDSIEPQPHNMRKLQPEDDKGRPDKSELHNCSEIQELWDAYFAGETATPLLPPCRNGAFEEGNSGNTGIEDGDNAFTGLPTVSAEQSPTDSQRPDFPDVNAKDNRIALFIVVALPPGRPTHRIAVSKIITQYLNETGYGVTVYLSTGRHRELQQHPNQRQLTERPYNMYYQNTLVRQLGQGLDRWWWRYDFNYGCFWGDTGKPVRNRTKLDIFKHNLTGALDVSINSGVLQQRIMELAQEPFLEVLASGEPLPILPPPGESAPAPPNEDTVSETNTTFMNPLDAQEWDYRRWLGLGLFCGTVVATVVLTQVASYRMRKRNEKEQWGNLTKEGVDELLQTGWTIKGNNMEVYDKAKVGYTDDDGDSTFMGGFEQKHEVVGAEITVTQSTTTPDTGNRS